MKEMHEQIWNQLSDTEGKDKPHRVKTRYRPRNRKTNPIRSEEIGKSPNTRGEHEEEMLVKGTHGAQWTSEQRGEHTHTRKGKI